MAIPLLIYVFLTTVLICRYTHPVMTEEEKRTGRMLYLINLPFALFIQFINISQAIYDFWIFISSIDRLFFYVSGAMMLIFLVDYTPNLLEENLTTGKAEWLINFSYQDLGMYYRSCMVWFVLI